MAKLSAFPASLLAALLLSLSVFPSGFAQSSDAISLPDLGEPSANSATVQPNISAQGAGFTYHDTIDGKQITLTPQYSRQNGTAIGGSLAGPLTHNMAVGVLLTVGSDKNEWLLNTGFDLSSKQRFIFTLGQLRQKQDFNFISGNHKANIRQDNVAASYQYYLAKDWLNAAEINAYISDTGSVNLSDKTYFTDTTSLYELWSDPRRIAGGRVSGVQGRLVFTPTARSNLKLGFGAEHLSYDLLSGNDRTTRATGSAEFNQRLSQGFDFRASANAGAAQSRYALGLGKSFKDGAQLGLDVATIQGRDNTFNDTQVMLSYSQIFGGSASMPLGNLEATDAAISSPVVNRTAPDTTATPWASSLVEQVARRPSFLPAQVVAKIDTSATPTRLIAIDKTALPEDSSIDKATGILAVPLGIAVSDIAGVTKNASPFTTSGQFALSDNTHLVINPNLITPPATGTDTYVVTMNNSSGGGTTLATVVVSAGSTKIDSVVISSGTIVINVAAIAGVTPPVAGATPVTSATAGTGYTGTVSWSPTVSGTFVYNTTYTATVTLTASSGYTFTGVAENFFTVAGTSSAAIHAANSGVVTAVFPATTAAGTQITPSFSPDSGEIAFGSTVTITSADADAIYYTIDGSTPTTASTNQATTPLVINSAVTVKALAVRSGYNNSTVGSATYTQAAATAPSSITLAVGSSNPVGGVTNVAIPAAGATDSTGAVYYWEPSSADTIKFTVVNGGASTSSITINGGDYTSGNDYTIATDYIHYVNCDPLPDQSLPIPTAVTIIVTTTEANKATAVRTFSLIMLIQPIGCPDPQA